jgi:hypothetical protein
VYRDGDCGIMGATSAAIRESAAKIARSKLTVFRHACAWPSKASSASERIHLIAQADRRIGSEAVKREAERL